MASSTKSAIASRDGSDDRMPYRCDARAGASVTCPPGSLFLGFVLASMKRAPHLMRTLWLRVLRIELFVYGDRGLLWRKRGGGVPDRKCCQGVSEKQQMLLPPKKR